MTARVHLIRCTSRFERCCECSRLATHLAVDEAPSALCNTHLPAWMAWRGMRFDYEGAA